jgi:hypothetical protein
MQWERGKERQVIQWGEVMQSSNAMRERWCNEREIMQLER